MVLAFAVCIINITETALNPVIYNYVNECFVGHAQEVTTAMSFYRLILGLTVTFYIQPWIAAVGLGWTFGTSKSSVRNCDQVMTKHLAVAFVALVGFSFTIILAWKGHVIRTWSMERFKQSEDGDALF